jgi:radical SAM superfamily enzyme YgiQ (UPF0313 family)
MKSKVILILPPDSSDFDTFKLPSWEIIRIPPVGLIAIGSYVHEKGYEVKIIDCRELIVANKTNDYIPIVLKTIDEFRPDVIGINMLTATFDEATNISRELKNKYPNLLIIAGGPHPSVEPELTFQQNQYIDAICIGAGEEVCLDILDGKKTSAIPGLMRRDHTDRYEQRKVEMDLDKYPFPNYSLANADYTTLTVNTLTGWCFRGLPAISSRSCPYSCKFCASDWSKPFRFHSPEYVIEMVKYLSTFNIDVIPFMDDTISIVKERLHKICRGFIKAKLFYPHTHLRWYAQMRADQMDPDTLKLMKEAGCFGVSFGAESGSDRMLKIINKRTTVELNTRVSKYIEEAGLYLAASFMLGIPGETEADMEETITFMKKLPTHAKGFGSFRPLPGSPFYDEFIANGTLKKEELDWSNLGNFSKPPEYLFCDVSREKFDEIFDKASVVATRDKWTALHEDTFLKYPEIKEIATRERIKICKPDNYQSSAHIDYPRISFNLIKSILIALLRTYLPLGIRRKIRAIRRRRASQ